MNDKVLKIVIDPGHGGENLGLNYGGFLEKEMNIATAISMKKELEQYDNVAVFISNPDMLDLSLKERAEFAKSMEADLLISLHYNMSENHTEYGSEVFVPSKGLEYSTMRSLADVFLEEFQSLGVTSRGVKTRLNKRGEDYYGVIRESAELGIPAIIVEHCHADYEDDQTVLKQDQIYDTFGKLDATAVAKCYGLSSQTLNVNYESFIKNGYYAPESPIPSDETGPTQVSAQIVSGYEKTLPGIKVLLRGTDIESKLTYYDYSVDGGQTFSRRYTYESGTQGMIVTLDEVKPGDDIVFRLYNGYGKVSEPTQVLEFNEVYQETSKPVLKEYVEEVVQPVKEVSKAPIIAGLGVLAIVFVIGIVSVLRSKRLNTRQKEWRVLSVSILATVFFTISLIVLSTMGTSNTDTTKVDAKQIQKKYQEQYEFELRAWEEDCKNEKNALLLEAIKKFSSDRIVDEQYANELVHKEPETVVVYDIARGYLRVPKLEQVSQNNYDFAKLDTSGPYYRYLDDQGVKGIVGIDVSKYQGKIDWQTVKDSGVEYAILRIGIRGYQSGKLVVDERFQENAAEAEKAGMPIGVYIFSAAITPQEAIEEAEFVLELIKPYTNISYPIVFDTEPIYSDDSRIKDLTPNQLTQITKAFCDTIIAAGKKPMIYANAKRLTTVLRLDELTGYELWYADYQEKPIFPYQYRMWQYTEKGFVPGIEGAVDINLFFDKK